MVQIDARGLPCPQPVILTRNAMRANDAITILVSSEIQVANVSRLAEKSGWTVAVSETDDAFQLDLVQGAGRAPRAQPAPKVLASAPAGGRVIVFSSERMGTGPEELGGVLARAFFHTLTEIEPLPDTIILYNTGVRLAAKDSPVLEDLVALAERGVEILVCGTCTGYLGLNDSIVVGTISNMYTIAETLLVASLVVAP